MVEAQGSFDDIRFIESIINDIERDFIYNEGSGNTGTIQGLNSKTTVGNASIYKVKDVVGNANTSKIVRDLAEGSFDDVRFVEDVFSDIQRNLIYNNGSGTTESINVVQDKTTVGNAYISKIKDISSNANTFKLKDIVGTARLVKTDITKDVSGNAYTFFDDVTFGKVGNASTTFVKNVYFNTTSYISYLTNWEWTDNLNETDVATIYLAGIEYDNTDVAIDKEVLIYDGGLKFFGTVRNVRRVDNNIVEVIAKSYDIKLLDRKLYNSTDGNYTTVWTNTRTDDVATDLIAGQSVIVAGTLDDNGSDFDIKNENDYMLNTVKKLTKYGLGDFYITRKT